MTRGKPWSRRTLGVLALALVAGAWIYATVQLWETSVPEDLDLPELDPGDYFSSALLDEAESYQSFLDITGLLGALALLAALAVYAVRGERFARESAAGRIGTGMLLGMLGLAFVWLAQLPFGLVQLWWERRHEVTDVGYLDWLLQYWAAAGGQFLFISLALLIVMGIAGILRRYWWIAAVPALGAVAIAFAFVQPYLLPGLDPPHSAALAADVEELAAEQDISEPDVRVMDTYGATEAPNALAAGIGSSERVVLFDTLVESFDRAQVRAVLAHELAHLSRDHVWKLIAWLALLAIPVGALTAVATRRRGGLDQPGAVPLALFVVAVLAFLTAPLSGAFSQRLESEADWVALETTADPEAAQTMFTEFTRAALLDPDPPAWSQLGTSHPSIMRRLEMSEAWADLRGQAGAGEP